MFNAVTQNQRGFTLIEMSIVLVIIGLIVGGILKGQELINSSRQKNMISQIDRLKSATTTFQDRFRALPGDFSRVSLLQNSASLTPGNDTGYVGTQATGTAALSVVEMGDATENVEYFNHLLASGLGTTGSVSSAAPACFSGLCTTLSPLPSSAYAQSGLSILYGTHDGGTTAPAAKLAHWLILSRFIDGQLTTSQGAVSGEQAFQIDYKYDDGDANAGAIRSLYIGTSCGAAGSSYSATATTPECSLAFAVE